MNRFNFKKLNERCHYEVSYRFAALKNLNAEVVINGVWEAIRDTQKFQPTNI
jgi:hypothetical protein